MDSLSRQPDLDRLLYHSTVAVSTPNANSPPLAGLDGTGHTAQATAATVLSPEKADTPAAGEREEIQIQLVDKLQVVTSPVEAAAIGGGAGETLDATSQLEEAGAALDLAQRRALLLGRTKQRHVCLQCGRECPSKHKLKRHLSTHSEQRPYNCHLCGKSFKWTEYLAKHMRTQHPGVEVPSTFVAHGNSASPALDCASPPTPTTTSTPSSLTTTPSHSQLTPYQTSSTGGTDGSASGGDLSEGISVGSVSLGSGAIDENPIGSDAVFEASSHCPVSPRVTTSTNTTSQQSPMHTSLLAKPTTLSEAHPPTNELLQSQLSASSQVQQHQQLQQTPQQQNILRQSSQQSSQQAVPSPQSQSLIQQQQQPVLQQELLNHHQLQQQQQQQEQKKQQQKLLQQQIQQHQMQQLQQQALQQKQQQQQTLRQVSQQAIRQQPSSQQLHLVQPPQDLLQTTEQVYAASSPSAGALSPGQTQQVTAETSTQMGSLQATHPLSHHTHIMSSEASIGYVGENYDSAPASTSVVYTNDSFQDSSSSQVFTSPVYNTQSVTQVYQVPSQSQSTLTSENFDNFTAPADSFSTTTYASTMTSLPPQQLGFTGSITQQPGTQEGGLGNMNMQSHHSPDSNILHMQAQITQSAYELQSVQMQSTSMTSSMQTYNNSAMIQTSDNFQDNAYQEGTTMYQEGTNTYQTGTNTYQIQEGTGYQEGTSYQEHSQTAPQGQNVSLSTSYANTGLPATSVGSLSQDISRQAYSVPSQSQPYKQEESSQPQLANFTDAGSTVSEVVAYNQQIQAADSLIQQQTSVYTCTSVGPNTFQQTSLPGSGLQQPASTEANVLLSQQSQMLSTVAEIEAVVTGPPQSGAASGMEDATSTGSEQSNEKSNKKPPKPKVSIGIQCEVGPETFRVLKEEEAKLASSTSSNLQEVSGPNPSPFFQKHGNASLLLNSVGSPPVNELNTSSPSVNTSSSETTHSGLSDKVIRKYPCEVTNCSKAYVHRKDLIRHMTLRHGTSPQKLEPVVIETPEKPYTCQVGGCQKSYFHQKDLRRHQRQCHSVVDNSHLTEAVEMTDADGKVMVRFPCDFPGCQRSYVHKKDLVRHKRVYHKDESKKPSIPVPVKFTEADLKRIRHEEKAFHEKDIPDAKKLRLDSTGSMMSGGEDQSQFTEVSSIQISESVELGQLSTSPTPVVDYKGQNQVSYESLSSTEVEPTQLSNTLALGLSQHQPSERPIAPQSTQQPGVHLPTILRRQRQASNGQLASTASQDQQLTNGITLRNLASLMLGGLQGTTGNGSSGTSFDITQQAVAAFSSPGNSEPSSQPTESQQALAAAAAVAQFDPAAIISALTNVVNNPSQIQDMTQSPSLEQQQVVSMENVANALQFLTSTSSNT